MDFTDIDWSAAPCQVSNHFTVKECLYLPTWKRLAIESDFDDPAMPWLTVLQNIYDFAQVMDRVRDWYGCPFNVHVWSRPPKYNLLIGGAKGSAHLEGNAVDFNPQVNSCQNLIDALLAQDFSGNNELTTFGLRAEDNGKFASWVHLDRRAVAPGGSRFFKP